jgi:5-methylcytosine-specific restriction endonuclease McrA
MKICIDCEILKPLFDFYKRKNGYVENRCKECFLNKQNPGRHKKPNTGWFKKGNVPFSRKEINGRQSLKAKEWAKTVINRDGKCMHCNSLNRLVAHHIKSWKSCPKLRFDLNNGLTLCNSCHAKEHAKGKCNLLENGKPWHAGRKLSLEHRKKLSEAHKGKHIPGNGFKEGHIPWNKGTKGLYSLSGETKLKISLALKGRKHSAEHVRKRVEAAKVKMKGRIPWIAGKKHSKESILKMQRSQRKRYDNGAVSPNKGKKMSEEQKLKLIAANKGRVPPNKGKKMPSEQREKLKLAWKKRKADKENYKLLQLKMSESQKRRFENEDPWNKRKKMSDK